MSDITYLPLANGTWAYLCAFQDVCTTLVVGWQVRADMSEALGTSALQRALLAQRPAPGLIVHSDRGGQYVANAYKALLREAQASVTAYFDYYNHERRHFSIGYQKPPQFHQQQLSNSTQFFPA